MKTAIIYVSQTGFTKQYAEWISEEVGGDCFKLEEVEKKNLSGYDAIVFGGWCMAGTIKKLDWFKSKMSQWTDKKKVVFAVGASPMGNPELEEAFRMIFAGEEWNNVSRYYCPGGLRYESMKPVSKVMMKMFAKMMAGKKDKTEDEKIMAEMIGKSYDISDRKYIVPIVEYLRGE